MQFAHSQDRIDQMTLNLTAITGTCVPKKAVLNLEGDVGGTLRFLLGNLGSIDR